MWDPVRGLGKVYIDSKIVSRILQIFNPYIAHIEAGNCDLVIFNDSDI